MAYSGFSIAESFKNNTPFSLYSPSASIDDDDPDFSGIGGVNVQTGKVQAPKMKAWYDDTIGVSGTGGLRVKPKGPSTWRQDLSESTSRLNASRSSSSSNASSYLTPTMDKPTIGEFPEYNMPEVDRARIGELEELNMGAPMGRLKQGLDRAMIEARYSSNPTIRDLSRKAALSGFGSGISDIRKGAHQEAMSEYMPEFNASVLKAGAEYSTGVSGVNAQFQADMNEYLKTMRLTRNNNPGTNTSSTNFNTTQGAVKSIAPYRPPGGVLRRA